MGFKYPREIFVKSTQLETVNIHHRLLLKLGSSKYFKQKRILVENKHEHGSEKTFNFWLRHSFLSAEFLICAQTPFSHKITFAFIPTR